MLDRNAVSPNPLVSSRDAEGLVGGQSRESGENQEGLEAKVACAPCMPTQEEVERHNATHIPFRSWCPFCVAGKAKANPHYKKDSDRVCSENVVSLDYAFMGDRPAEEPDSDGDERTG